VFFIDEDQPNFCSVPRLEVLDELLPEEQWPILTGTSPERPKPHLSPEGPAGSSRATGTPDLWIQVVWKRRQKQRCPRGDPKYLDRVPRKTARPMERLESPNNAGLFYP